MGVDVREFPGGLLRLDPTFAYAELFLMTFAMGGVPHAGSRQQTIQYHSNPSLCPTNNAEEAEVERF